MEKTIFRFALMLVLACALFVPPTAGAARSQVASAPANGEGAAVGAMPAGLLNPDGTLNLASNFSGPLSLSGWDVQMDPERGPVFSGQTPAFPVAASPGSWAALGVGGGGALGDEVTAIAVSGSNVYVGGFFRDVDNIPAADFVAKWNGGSWSALGADQFGNGSLSDRVYALAVFGDVVYVGGTFGGVANPAGAVAGSSRIAKWDGSSWSALGNDALDGAVYALAVDGSGNLYAGGFFQNVVNDGAPIPEADFVAKWDGADWSAMGNGGIGVGSLKGNVNALAVSGTDVYVGGDFTDVVDAGSMLDAADYIAKWDGSYWSALGADPSGDGSLNSAVLAIAISGSHVYVGGPFENVENATGTLTAADHIAMWDGLVWSALGSNGSGGDGSIQGYVNAIAVSGSDLYVGGNFINVNNNGTVLAEADRLARWDGADWHAVGSDGAGGGSIPMGAVNALGISGADVVVGGTFTSIKDTGTVLSHAAFIVGFGGSSWFAMGTIQGSLSDRVLAIAIAGSNVYVGGDFLSVVDGLGEPVPGAAYIAKWDGVHWSALGSNGSGGPALNASVLAMAVSGTDLYVGGWFSQAYNGAALVPEAAYIAKWDGLNWSALGSDGEGGPSLNKGVGAIAINGSDIYVGGAFTDVNNKGTPIPEADYVARWDGANWTALGNNGVGGGALNGQVAALAASGSNLYAGGYFTDVGSGAGDYVAMWNGASWSALGSDGSGGGALNRPVYALAVSGSNVYAGGGFYDVSNAGTPLGAADYIARWNGALWAALGSNGAGNGALDEDVWALAMSGTDLYVGGSFTDVHNGAVTLSTADRIARWDGANWSPLGYNGADNGSISTPADSNVFAVGVNAGLVYAGGDFYNVNSRGTLLLYADYVAVYGILPPNVRADFDGNRTSDLSVFRPGTGVWYVRNQFNTTWGTAGDVPVPGDYNGNGDADVAIFRPSTHIFYVKGQFNSSWGAAGDVPVPGDYDGNGTTDVAVWRPTTGMWYVKNQFSTSWGASGDIPVPGDYDGDRVTELAVWRPSTGVWYLKGVTNTTWGMSTDIPVPADYDGNGTTDVAVWRPSTGVWYVKGVFNSAWGNATDIPVPGDFNGDSHAEVAVWRPSDGKWYVKALFTTPWGSNGDFPLLAPDTNGDGDPYQ